MKQLILILVGATVLFMALAMAQEPETFAPLFFPPEETAPAETEIPPEVITSLSEFNSVLEHFYRFGGDERFLTRLAASEEIKEELRAEIRYLAASGVMQTLNKTRGSILSEDRLAPDVWQLLTEEEWRLQYHDGSGTPVNQDAIVSTITLRYVIQKSDGDWKVIVMEPTGL